MTKIDKACIINQAGDRMICTLDKLKNEIANHGIDLVMDFKDLLENQNLLLDIEPVKVTGEVSFLTYRQIRFDLHIEAVLTLPCALTLEPVKYPLSFDIEEIVSDDLESEYQITEDKIDLKEIVWGALIPEIPMKVYAPDADHKAFEPEPKTNKVFAQLKDHFDKK